MTNISLLLVSSEMLPLGKCRVGVGGRTVTLVGNLVAAERMISLGILGRRHDLMRPNSALLEQT